MCLGIVYGWVVKDRPSARTVRQKCPLPIHSCAPKTDWTQCCLCQTVQKEELKSPPTHYACSPETDGYSMIAANVPLFQAINQLPIMLDMSRLDDRSGIEETLRKKQMQISPKLSFSNNKLERARKGQLKIRMTLVRGTQRCDGLPLKSSSVFCAKRLNLSLS